MEVVETRDRVGARVHTDDSLGVAVEIEHEYAASVEQLSPEALEEGGENGGGDVVFRTARR